MSYKIWSSDASEDRLEEWESFQENASGEDFLVFILQENHTETMPQIEDMFHFGLATEPMMYFLEFLNDYDWRWGFDIPHWNGYTWDGEKLLHVFHFQTCKKRGIECPQNMRILFEEKGLNLAILTTPNK